MTDPIQKPPSKEVLPRGPKTYLTDRADIPKALEILNRAGAGSPPDEGDEPPK